MKVGLIMVALTLALLIATVVESGSVGSQPTSRCGYAPIRLRRASMQNSRPNYPMSEEVDSTNFALTEF